MEKNYQLKNVIKDKYQNCLLSITKISVCASVLINVEEKAKKLNEFYIFIAAVLFSEFANYQQIYENTCYFSNVLRVFSDFVWFKNTQK